MPWPGTNSSSALNGPLPIGLLAGGLRVLEEGLGQRVEGVVADGHRELRERRAQRDGEGRVVDDLEAAHLLRGGRRDDVAGVVGLGLQVVVALDVGEEVRAALGVGAQRRVVPRVDEGLRGDRGAVVEGPAVLERDRPGGGCRRTRSTRRRRCTRTDASSRVLDQAGPQRVDDLAALGLGGVARDERVLRLADVHAEGAAAAGFGPARRHRSRRCRHRRTASSRRRWPSRRAHYCACSTSRAMPPSTRVRGGNGQVDHAPDRAVGRLIGHERSAPRKTELSLVRRVDPRHAAGRVSTSVIEL